MAAAVSYTHLDVYKRQNPFLSSAAKALAAARTNATAPIPFSKRFNVLGPRASDNTFDVCQLTAGSTGKLGTILEDWTYDAYWSYGRTVLNETQDGNVRRDRVQAVSYTHLDVYKRQHQDISSKLNFIPCIQFRPATKALKNGLLLLVSTIFSMKILHQFLLVQAVHIHTELVTH